jgi:hypothetical protein
MSTANHLVQFFRADDRRISAMGRFVCEGLQAGDTCVVVMTADHRHGIEAQLIAAGLNPNALAAEYRYILLDAEELLATFFNSLTGIDYQRFHRDFGLLIRQAAARGQPVRICGEMVCLLVERDWPAVAIELEELWNELSRQYNFQLFCGYTHSAFTENPRYRKLLHSVHSHVLQEDC